MVVKTYAIDGLSEWHSDVKAGTISVKVSFIGGTASPSGALPAYMVTKDPVTQFVIEHSKEFKDGFIRLEMQQEVAGAHPRMAAPKQQIETVVSPEPQPEEGEPAPTEEASSVVGEAKEMAFACADDAKAYLMENHGIAASRLRTKAQIEQAGKDVGIKVVWE